MSSQLKSDTARANGAKSKGPKTAETREKSSRNSLKHGITSGHCMLLECEDAAMFQELVDEYISFYQPANPVERHLVEEIIGADWRIRRLKIIEVALVDYEMIAREEEIQKKLSEFDSGTHMGLSFKWLADDSRSVALLSRYESRLNRIYHRSHEAFMDLRRSIAAGLIGLPPATVAPQPPAHAPVQPAEPPAPAPAPPTETSPSDACRSNTKHPSPGAKKKCNNEPTIRRVLRRIRNYQPLNAAFRRSKKGPVGVAQARRKFREAS